MPGDLRHLPRERALLASVIECAENVQVYVLNRDLTYSSFNRAHELTMRALHGVSIEIGAGALGYIAEEDDCLVAARDFDRALAGERFTRTQERCGADGSRWYESFFSPLQDDRGRTTGITVFVIDVTDRKRAERTLREREQRLSRIQDAMSDVIFYIAVEPDGDYSFVSINRAFLTETGLSEDQVCGKLVRDVIPEPARDIVVEHYAEAIRERKTVRWEEVSVYPAGEKHGEVAVTPIFDEEGCCTHLVGTVRDVTEYRRLESRIQQTQKLESLGVLAGGIAHDFNNLLAGILGNTDLAYKRLDPSSRARPLLREVIKASQQAAELTNQLLAYSGKGHFVVEKLNLDEVVKEMGSLLQSSISKKVRLKYVLDDELPAIMGDVSQLRQIVMNFVTNASAACGEKGGLIEIKTGTINCDGTHLSRVRVDDELPEGHYVSLQVSDTGSGMEPETIARIFDPFFSTKPEGRGLGLAAVLGIVRGHKGAIWVDSEPGVGTTFNVLLPALDHRAKPVDLRATEGDNLRHSGTVLVVDDVEMIRTLARRILEGLGFTVLTASNGDAAIEIFRERHAELACVLLDLKMPHRDGEETFEELRAICDDVPVILSSGYAEQESTKRFAGKGLAGFIQKPYTVRALENVIEDVLGPAGAGH